MSETAKRKGPPTKAELITRAVDDGVVSDPAALEKLTVKEIRFFIKQSKAKQQVPEAEMSRMIEHPTHDRKQEPGTVTTTASTKGWTDATNAEHLPYEPITEKEPGPEEPAMVIHNGELTAVDDLPVRKLKVDMFPQGAKMEWVPNEDTHPDIPEIKEPNCGHIFRKVLEIHKGGNIHVNICNICGWRETVK